MIFNTPGVKENCIFLDNPHQARRFHQEMLNLFLKYSANLGANGKVNIAIVGGGATGVELSAELHNAVKQLHSYGYKGLTNESAERHAGRGGRAHSACAAAAHFRGQRIMS
ncbi:FAD-dependent pyridine nucleotide-disulfide oxidoreductase [Klebsiella pneumoniae subsp. rhinoscleromatis]|nr:FAD-dependent pyridine nucleotide-disulfide oxidoreductase [Klebsiella pneumoniae subsp. rhinoscleromatis]